MADPKLYGSQWATILTGAVDLDHTAAGAAAVATPGAKERIIVDRFIVSCNEDTTAFIFALYSLTTVLFGPIYLDQPDTYASLYDSGEDLHLRCALAQELNIDVDLTTGGTAAWSCMIKYHIVSE